MQNRLILVDTLDRLLPQTQCQRCGYPACRPYAQALADGQTEPNRCPPGGQAGADALADAIGRPRLALDLARGEAGVGLQARIVEHLCIGCTTCIRACPVDAIIGGSKGLHHVIAARCTGCALCLPPCPTDCIELVPRPDTAWQEADAEQARLRFQARQRRLAQSTVGDPAEPATASQAAPDSGAPAGTTSGVSPGVSPGATPGASPTPEGAAPAAVALQSAVDKAMAAARQRLAQRQARQEK